VRIAYLDCSTGISGDMMLAALIDAGVDVEAIRRGIASLKLPGVQLITETVSKKGFRATAVRVEHPEQHAHRHLSDILELVEQASALTDSQRSLARRVFRAIAEAEAKVHGKPVQDVHFHEVGAVDSIVDIVGVAIGVDLLQADRIVASPVPTGRGQVHIAHGVCPVPAPGTAELLKGIPLADVPIEAELTTPTGAAFLATLVDEFGPLPAMTIEAIGYGAGSRDLPDRANLLRLFIGTRMETAGGEKADQIDVLETNLDDVSAEVIGYTKQRLLEAGALDVFTVPVQMKKDRPGVVLTVLAWPADAPGLERILFDETGTLGIRRHRAERSKRRRDVHQVETSWGSVWGKLAWRADGTVDFAPEFESCAEVARRKGVPFRDVYRAAQEAFDPQRVSAGSAQKQDTEADLTSE